MGIRLFYLFLRRH